MLWLPVGSVPKKDYKGVYLCRWVRYQDRPTLPEDWDINESVKAEEVLEKICR